jgi:hypothetical protein
MPASYLPLKKDYHFAIKSFAINLSGATSACQILFSQTIYKNPVSLKEKRGSKFDKDRKEKLYLGLITENFTLGACAGEPSKNPN